LAESIFQTVPQKDRTILAEYAEALAAVKVEKSST